MFWNEHKTTAAAINSVGGAVFIQFQNNNNPACKVSLSPSMPYWPYEVPSRLLWWPTLHAHMTTEQSRNKLQHHIRQTLQKRWVLGESMVPIPLFDNNYIMDMHSSCYATNPMNASLPGKACRQYVLELVEVYEMSRHCSWRTSKVPAAGLQSPKSFWNEYPRQIQDALLPEHKQSLQHAYIP